MPQPCAHRRDGPARRPPGLRRARRPRRRWPRAPGGLWGSTTARKASTSTRRLASVVVRPMAPSKAMIVGLPTSHPSRRGGGEIIEVTSWPIRSHPWRACDCLRASASRLRCPCYQSTNKLSDGTTTMTSGESPMPGRSILPRLVRAAARTRHLSYRTRPTVNPG